jgi:hypothetical protein
LCSRNKIPDSLVASAKTCSHSSTQYRLRNACNALLPLIKSSTLLSLTKWYQSTSSSVCNRKSLVRQGIELC